MQIGISNPNLMMIQGEGRTSFGGNQAWYKNAWRRKAGCGPTCGANITAYLSLTNPQFKGLYKPKDMSKNNFLHHMNDLYTYITPGAMGVNKISMFENGINKLAKDRVVSIKANTFVVESMDLRKANVDKLYTFVEKGLSENCPIAFLNLSNGSEHRLQNWHWITITQAHFLEEKLIATASDEGVSTTFDLRLWYETTKMHGGLIYFNQ